MMRWDDDEGDDHDLPDASDITDDEGGESQSCAECGSAISDDVEMCPKCGMYVMPQSTARKPLWWLAGVALCVLIVILLWTR